jgi:hypothetical protein
VGNHRIDTVTFSGKAIMTMMMMTAADEMERMSKKSAMAYFKVLSQSLPGRSKENRKKKKKKLNEDSRFPD